MTRLTVPGAGPPCAGVICSGNPVDGRSCGEVDLDSDEYDRQMARPDSFWRCPLCGGDAEFDDARFEQLMGIDGVEADDDSPF